MSLVTMLARRQEKTLRAKSLASKEDLTTEERVEADALITDVKALDLEIVRVKALVEAARETAAPVVPAPGTPNTPNTPNTKAYVAAQAKKADDYETDATLSVAGMMKAFVLGGNSISGAMHEATKAYGESHPVTKALAIANGAAGGFTVSPDMAPGIIEILRPNAVLRAAGPQNWPMPRGTLLMPGQASQATASWGNEQVNPSASEVTFDERVASYKTLTALIPVTRDLLDMSNYAVDVIVRNDLVKVLANSEDLKGFMGDGTSNTPRGVLSFANGYVGARKGTMGIWSSAANSTLAVNGTDPANSTGGNFITSNATFTLATVTNELAGAVNKLDSANVPETRRVWFFHPVVRNYLYNVQNSLGNYVFRDEMKDGKLLGYPYRTTTQIPRNIWDASGTNKDLSFVFLLEMDDLVFLDTLQLELAISTDATYTNAAGVTVNAFSSRQVLFRATRQMDIQVRHDASIAIIQAVRWAPAG